MTQHTFAADNPASLTNLDANFTELYSLYTRYTFSSSLIGMGGTPVAKFEVFTGTGAWNAINARYNAANAPIGFGVANSNGYAYLANNSKQVSGTDGQTYDITAAATQLRMDGGAFVFNRAASGTAGNAITWVEAARVDSSGNTLPGADNTQTFGSTSLRWLAVYTSQVSDGTNQLIGSSSTTARVGYGAGWTAVSIATGGTERVKIDSTGLMVGTTSSTAPNPGVALLPAGTAHFGNSAAATGFTFQSFQRSATAIGSITQSGTTAVLYNTTSDARLKTNIVDAPDAGGIIDAIKVRAFDWMSAPDDHISHGFIAQELAAHAPQAVKVGDSGDEVTDAWAVDPSKLVALLVKEVQSLRARVAALETP